VMSTLVTRHDIEFLGEEIDYLALALVAPLRAQHDDVGHLGTKATIVSKTYHVPSATCSPQRFCTSYAVRSTLKIDAALRHFPGPGGAQGRRPVAFHLIGHADNLPVVRPAQNTTPLDQTQFRSLAQDGAVPVRAA